VLLHKSDPNNEESVLELLAQHEVVLKAVAIEPNRVQIDGQDITAALHTDDVDANVSSVAILAQVRAWVNERLREVQPPFVIEGRDMGSVVFPKASHKFYLTASAQVRAKRRVNEREADLKEVEKALRQRDEKDKNQLQAAPDATQLDTSQLSLKQVVEKILSELKANPS
jgi:cytidylate kinase